MKHRWLRALALQIAEMIPVCLISALSEGAGALPRALALWGLVPLAGMITACQAVRRGLNNYLAWIAPAPCLYGVNWLVWRYAPPPGPALLTAFLALAGSAAGQVILQRNDRQMRRRRR